MNSKNKKNNSGLWIIGAVIFGLMYICNNSSDGSPSSTRSVPTVRPTQRTQFSTATPTKVVLLTAFVDTSSLNVRSGPGTDFSIVGGLVQNDCVYVDARSPDDDWGRIRGNKGWVALWLVTLDRPSSALPYASPSNNSSVSVPTSPPVSNSLAPNNSSGGGSNCHPSYPTVCIPPAPPDLDCKHIPYNNFRVTGSDPHNFDLDFDGLGCEG